MPVSVKSAAPHDVTVGRDDQKSPVTSGNEQVVTGLRVPRDPGCTESVPASDALDLVESDPQRRVGHLTFRKRPDEHRDELCERGVPDRLASKQEGLGRGFVGQPLHFALTSDTRPVPIEQQPVPVGALSCLVDRPITGHEKEPVFDDRDPFEIVAHDRIAHGETLHEFATFQIDFVDDRPFIIVREQPSIRCDGEAGNLAEPAGKPELGGGLVQDISLQRIRRDLRDGAGRQHGQPRNHDPDDPDHVGGNVQ